MGDNIPKYDCKLFYYTKKNVIASLPTGTWDGDTARRNRSEIKEMAKIFKGEPWVFLGLIEHMKLVPDAQTAIEFSKFHSEFYNMNCKTIIFATGDELPIKIRSKRHQDMSCKVGLNVIYVETEQEAIDIIKNDDSIFT
ncbi:MAG: hypothetical protein ABF289_11090 [Clostridiales bacterium]